MIHLSLKHEIAKKELQLNALFEIIQAINSNVSEESLYKILNFTLRANLRIDKLALFVLDKQWKCKTSFGTQHNFKKITLNAQYTKIKKLYTIPSSESNIFCEFDMVIPMIHKSDTLAIVCIGHTKDNPFDKEIIKFIQAISNIIIVAIENKKIAKKQLAQKVFYKELEIASDVQHLLFPQTLPCTDQLKIEASYLPHDLVGGDYYDYIRIDKNRFFICVADVSGKGVPASIIMSNFQATLHTLLRQTTNIKKIVNELNYQVFESTKGEKFITFFGALYDTESKTLNYINAGHIPPLLFTEQKNENLLNKGTMVLGVVHPLPFLHEGLISNLDNFFLFAYTDGITETSNESEKQFGQHILAQYLSKNRNNNLKNIHHDIILMLDEFKGKNAYKDDITMLSCHVSNTTQ